VLCRGTCAGTLFSGSRFCRTEYEAVRAMRTVATFSNFGTVRGTLRPRTRHGYQAEPQYAYVPVLKELLPFHVHLVHHRHHDASIAIIVFRLVCFCILYFFDTLEKRLWSTYSPLWRSNRLVEYTCHIAAVACIDLFRRCSNHHEHITSLVRQQPCQSSGRRTREHAAAAIRARRSDTTSLPQLARS